MRMHWTSNPSPPDGRLSYVQSVRASPDKLGRRASRHGKERSRQYSPRRSSRRILMAERRGELMIHWSRVSGVASACIGLMLLPTACSPPSPHSSPEAGSASHSATAQSASSTQNVYLRTTGTQGFVGGFRLHQPPCSSPEDCPLALTLSSGASTPGKELSGILLGMQWSQWSPTEAIGTGSFTVLGGNQPSELLVRVVLRNPVQVCGQYYWSTLQLTSLNSVPPPARLRYLLKYPMIISNVSDHPCPTAG
jgi:hypothetical protein